MGKSKIARKVNNLNFEEYTQAMGGTVQVLNNRYYYQGNSPELETMNGWGCNFANLER